MKWKVREKLEFGGCVPTRALVDGGLAEKKLHPLVARSIRFAESGEAVECVYEVGADQFREWKRPDNSTEVAFRRSLSNDLKPSYESSDSAKRNPENAFALR